MSASVNADLSRAMRVDAHLLAIVRIEDKRSMLQIDCQTIKRSQCQ